MGLGRGKEEKDHDVSPTGFLWSQEAQLRQDPFEAILVISGRRALIFFCLKALGKNEK